MRKVNLFIEYASIPVSKMTAAFLMESSVFQPLVMLGMVLHQGLNFNLCCWQLAFLPDPWLLCICAH